MKTINTTLLLLLFLVGVSSCEWHNSGIVSNPHEIFGKVGYISDEPNSLVALDSSRPELPGITDNERSTLRTGDTLTINYSSNSYTADIFKFRLSFILNEIRDDHPNYLRNFDVTNYKKRRPRLKRLREVHRSKSTDLCMAQVEKVEITSNYAFGEDYPIGKNLAPLSTFFIDSYEEYIKNGFTPSSVATGHTVKGDDVEAWKLRRLFDSIFWFRLPKPADFQEDKDICFTFTFHVVDKLKSDTSRKTLKRTIRLKMEPHKQA